MLLGSLRSELNKAVVSVVPESGAAGSRDCGLPSVFQDGAAGQSRGRQAIAGRLRASLKEPRLAVGILGSRPAPGTGLY